MTLMFSSDNGHSKSYVISVFSLLLRYLQNCVVCPERVRNNFKLWYTSKVNHSFPFLQRAAKKRKFQVIVAECAPFYHCYISC